MSKPGMSSFFKGFANGLFIVHSSSIDYYYPDSDKIARDIFKIQNGSGIGNDIHSFSPMVAWYCNGGK